MNYTIENTGRGYFSLRGLFPFLVVLDIDENCPRGIVRLHSDAGGSDPYLRTNSLVFYDDDGYELIWDTKEYRSILKNTYDRIRFVPDITVGEAFATVYHIDTEKGLRDVLQILDNWNLRKPYTMPIKTPPEIKEKLSIARKLHLKKYDC